MKLSVLVPVFQEEGTVGKVLRQLVAIDLAALDTELEIIVCDDGSTDGSVREVQRVQRDHGNIKLLSHRRNRGKGRAIRTALDHATGDFVLIQDADLEYDMAAYPLLIAAARAGADIVFGSRFLHRGYPTGMRLANYVANRILTATANILFGLRITDEATCLKLVRTDLARSLRLQCEHFEFCPELTAKVGLLGSTIREVPVNYQARRARDGKKICWTDGVQALAVLIRHRFRSDVTVRNASIDTIAPSTFVRVLKQRIMSLWSAFSDGGGAPLRKVARARWWQRRIARITDVAGPPEITGNLPDVCPSLDSLRIVEAPALSELARCHETHEREAKVGPAA